MISSSQAQWRAARLSVMQDRVGRPSAPSLSGSWCLHRFCKPLAPEHDQPEGEGLQFAPGNCVRGRTGIPHFLRVPAVRAVRSVLEAWRDEVLERGPLRSRAGGAWPMSRPGSGSASGRSSPIGCTRRWRDSPRSAGRSGRAVRTSRRPAFTVGDALNGLPLVGETVRGPDPLGVRGGWRAVRVRRARTGAAPAHHRGAARPARPRRDARPVAQPVPAVAGPAPVRAADGAPGGSRGSHATSRTPPSNGSWRRERSIA